MEQQHSTYPEADAFALQHLTGPCRGRATWLTNHDLRIALDRANFPHVAPGDADDAGIVASLRRENDSYEIIAPKDSALWVNGRRVTTHKLVDRDLIEFGEEGPLSRFRVYREERSLSKQAGEIVRDELGYLKVSRKPIGRRMAHAVSDLAARLMRETTLMFRLGVVVALLILAGFAYQQARLNALLLEQVASDTGRIDEFAAALAKARDDALTPADLSDLRAEFGSQYVSAEERLQALEKRSYAAARVIAAARNSVVFLQGAYGFRETASGLMLRHVVDDTGSPTVSISGQPLLSTEGNGPVAERQFSGTGFVVGDGTRLVTNRHVARPWENDDASFALSQRELEPVMLKFLVYVPGLPDAGTVDLIRLSDEADLALLSVDGIADMPPGLILARERPDPGDAILVMGYPAGLRSMLAQTGEAFVTELMEAQDTNFWSVAALLAKRGHIVPLASRGIVAKATEAAIVYDAETTHGGSGGPVLDMNGEVVAINTAILPEFGGANLGVPAEKVLALLAADESG